MQENNIFKKQLCIKMNLDKNENKNRVVKIHI